MNAWKLILLGAAGLAGPGSLRAGPFPHPPPIADANPAVRKLQAVLVPTAFKAFRTAQVLAVGRARENLRSIQLSVGSKMILGMRTDLYIYPAGGVRSGTSQGTTWSDLPQTGSSGASFLYPQPDGFLQAGKPFVVELDVCIFETDIPPQHEWMPESPKYKILWKKTLRQTPQEQDQLPEEFRPATEVEKPLPPTPAK